MKLRYLPIILLAVFLAGSCGPKKPKPPDSDERPTLLYQPDGARYQLKYPLRVGVMTMRDRRLMPFYEMNDSFFNENLVNGASDMLYAELRSSGLFGEVKRIASPPPDRLTSAELLRIKSENMVDLLVVGDLVAFNLLREKSGDANVEAFKVMVDIGMVLQLVYIDKGFVVWADYVKRQGVALGETGVLSPSELGALSRQTMKEGMEDVKLLIAKTGKKMVVQ